MLTRIASLVDIEARVVEVAPMREMERLWSQYKNVRYSSFDKYRYAMERGDLLDLHYEDESIDVFVCFHVLEHIEQEPRAIVEILRVLKPGGIMIVQVPIDWGVAITYEYDQPDQREVGHVRRYGRDFASRMSSYGFVVKRHDVGEVATDDEITLHGLCEEPIFIAAKPAGVDGRLAMCGVASQETLDGMK